MSLSRLTFEVYCTEYPNLSKVRRKLKPLFIIQAVTFLCGCVHFYLVKNLIRV